MRLLEVLFGLPLQQWKGIYIHGLSPILLGCPPSLQTSMKVEEGVRQLEKAEKKQKQSGMVLCIMLLLVAIVVMVLLVIFKAIFL